MVLLSSESVQVSELPAHTVTALSQVWDSPEATFAGPQRNPGRSQAVALQQTQGTQSPCWLSPQAQPVLCHQHFSSTAQLKSDNEYSSLGCSRVTWFSEYAKSELIWTGREERFPQRKHLIVWVEPVGNIKLVTGRRGILPKWLSFLHWLARCHPGGRNIQTQKKKHRLGLKGADGEVGDILLRFWPSTRF